MAQYGYIVVFIKYMYFHVVPNYIFDSPNVCSPPSSALLSIDSLRPSKLGIRPSKQGNPP